MPDFAQDLNANAIETVSEPEALGQPAENTVTQVAVKPQAKRRPAGTKPRAANVKAKEVEKALDIEAKRLLLEYFPELFLGESTYAWQFNALKALGHRNSRVAVKAANGSGKTSKLVLCAILWHMIRFPGSQTVVTAGVYRQIADVLWPALRTKLNGLGGTEAGWNITENRILYTLAVLAPTSCTSLMKLRR
jgi:hypothetical protein